MKLLVAALVALTLLLPGARAGEGSRTCIFQTLSESDHQFCRGDLEVIYPEVGDVSCSYIPKCHGYREKLSQEWAKPRVRYPWAKKDAARSRSAAKSRWNPRWLPQTRPIPIISGIPMGSCSPGSCSGRSQLCSLGV